MEVAVILKEAFWEENSGKVFLAPDQVAPSLEGAPEYLLFFATSGSSGDPKWVGITRKALLLSAAAVNQHLQVQKESCWGLLLPHYHVGGFGVLARAFQASCRFSEYEEERWDPFLAVTWLREERVSHLSLVPTQVHDLVSNGIKAPACLEAVVVGGGQLSEELGLRARALGWPVLASYGMTEAGSQVATQSLESLGGKYLPFRIPVLPLWEVEVGQVIRLRGEALFEGYWSENKGWERRKEDWFSSSDLGSLEEGGLTIEGRVDQLVKVRGELISISLLESYFRAEFLAECWIVPVPDTRLENRLVIVFEGEMEFSEREKVKDFCRSIEGLRRPQSFVQLSEIPRSAMRKVQRLELVNAVLDCIKSGNEITLW